MVLLLLKEDEGRPSGSGGQELTQTCELSSEQQKFDAQPVAKLPTGGRMANLQRVCDLFKVTQL